MFSFCCVDVDDNLLYKVNIVCLLIYFLKLFKLFSISISFVCHICYESFLYKNLHELARKFDKRNLRKKTVQVSCASSLTVCHPH